MSSDTDTSRNKLKQVSLLINMTSPKFTFSPLGMIQVFWVHRQCFWVCIHQKRTTTWSLRPKSTMLYHQLRASTSSHGSMNWDLKLFHTRPQSSQFKWTDGLMTTCLQSMMSTARPEVKLERLVKMLSIKRSPISSLKLQLLSHFSIRMVLKPSATTSLGPISKALSSLHKLTWNYSIQSAPFWRISLQPLMPALKALHSMDFHPTTWESISSNNLTSGLLDLRNLLKPTWIWLRPIRVRSQLPESRTKLQFTACSGPMRNSLSWLFNLSVPTHYWPPFCHLFHLPLSFWNSLLAESTSSSAQLLWMIKPLSWRTAQFLQLSAMQQLMPPL